MPLPTDAKARKDMPIFRGLLMYFPDACAAVAEVSRIGSEQHHPGQGMFWERGKSMDQEDCLVRHLMEKGTLDSDGLPHSAKVAWRALALLQLELEEVKRMGGWGHEDTFSPLPEKKPVEPVNPSDNICLKCGAIRGTHMSWCSFIPAAASYSPPPKKPVGVRWELPFEHCEGCHSHVCRQTGACMHKVDDPH